jgi:hypothetical protein
VSEVVPWRMRGENCRQDPNLSSESRQCRERKAVASEYQRVLDCTTQNKLSPINEYYCRAPKNFSSSEGLDRDWKGKSEYVPF